jgi:uncharacterized OsmC-like protein
VVAGTRTAAVEQAIKLSEEKYCSYRYLAHAATITYDFNIVDIGESVVESEAV